MDYEEYKRKALEPIVNYIESVMASYSKEELEARIKKALPEKESEDERIRKFLVKHVFEWIGCIEHDLKISSKDVESEEELAMFKAGLAWLEKQKDEAQKQFNLGMQAGREEVLYEMEKEQKPVAQTEKEKQYVKTIKNLVDKHFETTNGFDKAYYDHIKEWLDGYHIEQKPAEWREGLIFKKDFIDAVYACAWGKVTTKVEGETQEEYAERWAEHLISMIRDWADDYIDSQIELAKRKAYDKGKADAEKPAEWSEEDEDYLMDVKSAINDFFDEGYAEELCTWLKSLRPQPQWKPSEEQIEAVEEALEFYSGCTDTAKGLRSLYNDLKKL